MPPVPPAEGEEPPPPPPPLPFGGWLVESVEMLAGATPDTTEEGAGAGADRQGVARKGGGGLVGKKAEVVFELSKAEARVLGERATARMAGRDWQIIPFYLVGACVDKP